jgi:hypothetical protein
MFLLQTSPVVEPRRLNQEDLSRRFKNDKKKMIKILK